MFLLKTPTLNKSATAANSTRLARAFVSVQVLLVSQQTFTYRERTVKVVGKASHGGIFLIML
jgi:hypothetical protein